MTQTAEAAFKEKAATDLLKAIGDGCEALPGALEWENLETARHLVAIINGALDALTKVTA